MDVQGKIIIVEEQQRLLCFEHVPNGNLGHYIKEKSYGFEWSMRYQIIKGICQGLQYLHQERIYHLDLKPENVLLGAQMEPKITDFGLSRCFVGQKSTIITSNILGTMGYMAPELIDNQQISFKADIFSFGVTLAKLLLQSNEPLTQNWHQSLDDEDCPQMKMCVEIARSCTKRDPNSRPTIGEILHQLNKTEIMFQKVREVYEPSKDPQSSLFKILQRFHKLSAQTPRKHSRDSGLLSDGETSSRSRIADGVSRGSIAAVATYRPVVPLDIFSCPIPPSSSDGDNNEISLTDGVSYNHNCRSIPAVALKALIAKKPELASECGATADDVDNGRATGLVFVSERDGGLETLHVALRCNGKVKVLSLADIYGADNFGGVRMEDTGGFGTSFVGHYADPSIIYVSTKTRVGVRRTPWTAVYRTNLRTGETKRLTPDGQSDLSPAVSPSGTRVAVASFRSGWTGEIEHLKTDIVLMNVDRYASGGSLDRKPIINDGGWPSWGSDNIIFFHRGVDELEDPASGRSRTATSWGVFRCDLTTMQIDRVTPTGMDAMTPAAISETKVAVATIRLRTTDDDMRIGCRVEAQYRHIEIFDVSSPDQPPVKITQNIFTKADYYSPFVLDGGSCIGYHRVGRNTMIQKDNGNSNVPRIFDNMQSPHVDVKLFRVSGLVPSFSADGSKLAFVGNDFKSIWLADKQGQREVHKQGRISSNYIFSLVWNQNPDMDTLYACAAPSFFSANDNYMVIYAVSNVSSSDSHMVVVRRLTKFYFNAYPSTNPEGTKIVFQSTRDDRGDSRKRSSYTYKNLYIMEDAQMGELGKGSVTRLTSGPWTDTQCQWSPRGNWIVFSSTRDKPAAAPENYNELDPGHFAIYLVNAADPTVVVRVVTSGDPGPGASSIAGHVNNPAFSPDGRSIAFTSDIAAVSAEPISMPMAKVMASVRPYGDIFSVNIDPNDICRNKDIDRVHRVTHSRYEYSTCAWTKWTDDPEAQWYMLLNAAASI
ncbi:uncharacterized protein [Setaria viridis]|nr:uncharacterized protein LOC117866603 isoform X2 [Setaria viridis]XP_034606744.1 uncharacterized protein LOC117866603 isoform X2 [Setaria viridis]XP_034606745.1 uncharacterized protein LOC117866603 isoform X2 [Setaria viridis]